jgi:REP element-mobilizing transposase RayT
MKNRKNLRLKNYDYSRSGYYFITICTQNRLGYLGTIENGIMTLNDSGVMIGEVWLEMPTRFEDLYLHEFVVMPNHFHAIVEIGALGQFPLGRFIGAFKSITTNRYIEGVKEFGWLPFEKVLWQRNYYEHIIRDETSYGKLSEYIQNNPSKWIEDRFYHP